MDAFRETMHHSIVGQHDADNDLSVCRKRQCVKHTYIVDSISIRTSENQNVNFFDENIGFIDFRWKLKIGTSLKSEKKR